MRPHYFIKPSEKQHNQETLDRRAKDYLFDVNGFVEWCANASTQRESSLSITDNDNNTKNGPETCEQIVNCFTGIEYDATRDLYTIDVDFSGWDRNITLLYHISGDHSLDSMRFKFNSFRTNDKTIVHLQYTEQALVNGINLPQYLNRCDPSNPAHYPSYLSFFIHTLMPAATYDLKNLPAGEYALSINRPLTYVQTVKQHTDYNITLFPRLSSFEGYPPTVGSVIRLIALTGIILDSFKGLYDASCIDETKLSIQCNSCIFNTLDFENFNNLDIFKFNQHTVSFIHPDVVEREGIERCKEVFGRFRFDLEIGEPSPQYTGEFVLRMNCSSI